MATGVLSQNKSRRRKIPITLSYVGKQSEESIISCKGMEFENILPVNGSGENMLFTEIILKLFCSCCIMGIKEKSN